MKTEYNLNNNVDNSREFENHACGFELIQSQD